MTARITLELGSDEVTAALARLTAVGRNLLPIYQDIGEYLLSSTRDRTASQRAPDGSAWTPLNPAYKRWKAKKRPGVPMLRFDFHMLGDRLSYQADDHALLFGTGAKYGAVHQFGYGKVPARPWLGLADEDELEVVEIVADHYERALEGSGGAAA